jgi:hypothetical protein
MSQANQVVTKYVFRGLGYFGLLCNLSYAGMRSQNAQNDIGRTVTFIGGFPGTLVTYFAVEEGSCRCYGVDLPSKKCNNDTK